jgi:hypothetical protein
VSPDFLRTLRVHILAGRTFLESDVNTHPPPLVLSRSLAEFLWPGQKLDNAVGRCLVVDMEQRGCSTVVGVARDVRYGYAAQSRYVWNAFYALPSSPATSLGSAAFRIAYFVASTGDLDNTATRVREVIREVVPDLPMPTLRVEPTQLVVLGRRILPWEYMAAGTTYFGVLALLLGVVALSANFTLSVVMQRKPLALKMALGASRPGLALAILLRALRISLIGGIIGSVLAVLSGPVFRQLEVGVESMDVWTIGAVGALVLALTGVASAVPIAWLVAVQPAELLRE